MSCLIDSTTRNPTSRYTNSLPLRERAGVRARASRALALLACSIALTAHAGQACEQKAADPQSVVNGMALAASTSKALDASGATVVLLARAGQDLSKYGLTYSHLGYAYRDSVDGKPRWRILHKLNHCGTAESALYRQGLGEFFLDQPYRYEAAFVVLSPAMQHALLPLLKDNAAVAKLNEPRYSMVAYAWAQTYQQSNQWAIETMSIAAEPGIANRRQAQAWMQLKGYEPSTLKLGPLTRLGARATSANVAFDDHPSEKRFSDRIETVTVDSVFAWTLRSGLGSAPVTVKWEEPR
jgi:hypothetical protein